MPRTLPWLAGGADKQKKKAVRTSSPPPPKRRKCDSSPEDLVDDDLNDVATPPPRDKQKKRVARTPSTSPAPAPPSVEYMRPGFAADDIFLMVEDEFHATAKTFTQHIHHAEYVRVKKAARARGEQTLQALDRGTDGRTEQSRGLQLRLEREANDNKKKEQLGGEESDENDPYMQDPQLAGLMKQARIVRTEPVGMVKPKVKTRAAAGFSQSPHTATRHRDALREDKVQKPSKGLGSKAALVLETFTDDEEDEEDEDSLDYVPKPKRKHRDPEPKQSRPSMDDGPNAFSSDRLLAKPKDESVFKRFADSSKNKNDEPTTGRAETSTVVPTRITDDHEFEPRKPPRPTYKKAQNRLASQIKVEPKDDDAPSLTSTSKAYGLFSRPIESIRNNRPSSGIGNSFAREEDAPKSTAPKTSIASPTPRAEGSQISASADPAKVAANSYLARRAAARERNEGLQQGRKKRVDDIPTFLA